MEKRKNEIKKLKKQFTVTEATKTNSLKINGKLQTKQSVWCCNSTPGQFKSKQGSVEMTNNNSRILGQINSNNWDTNDTTFTPLHHFFSVGSINSSFANTNNISLNNTFQTMETNQVKETCNEFEFTHTSSLPDQSPEQCYIRVCTPNGKVSAAKIYELSSSKFLVVLNPENYFYCIGIFEIELVQGSVNVFGYSLHDQKKKHMIFSPLGLSNLSITGTASNNIQSVKKEELLSLGLSNRYIKEVLTNNKTNSIFILSRCHSHVSSSVWPHFLKKHLPFSIFLQREVIESNKQQRHCHILERSIGCFLDANLHDYGNGIEESIEWLPIVQHILNTGKCNLYIFILIALGYIFVRAY